MAVLFFIACGEPDQSTQSISGIETKEVTDEVHYFKSDQELGYVNSDIENMSRYRSLNNNKKNLAGERQIRTSLIDVACENVSLNVVSKCSIL